MAGEKPIAVEMRPSATGDAPRLIDIYYRSLASLAAAGGETPSFATPKDDEFRLLLRDYFNRVSGVRDPQSLSSCRLALHGGQTIGWVSTVEEKDESERVGEINGVYVDPDYWHLGIGTRLLADRAGFLKERGVGRAILWADADNRINDRFYRSAGWTRRDDRQRETPGERIRALVMYERLLG